MRCTANRDCPVRLFLRTKWIMRINALPVANYFVDLAVALLLVLFSGFQYALNFEWTDSVLTTLLPMTTIYVIGTFILVVKYLFPTKDLPLTTA